ncbi:dihydroxy-acid dehydratase [Arboricoccus pini]|uniref:Dihydroxy-acid dehydratase n=1 Tax=Arboricoccus pini TaxID=1963835 RepID=A0A212QWL3_9PROT|nr:L-arabinonate dehydratase [Arboricoccus pini]SNB63938.1 dihydroxy-acid dehydratase [Arboricoccus pini]
MALNETGREKPRRAYEELRSYRWLGVKDLRAFGHRSRLMQMGYAKSDWAGKPVIGILNTWSDINPCHAHFKLRAEEVKRGIWQAGGFPLELPAISLSEPFVKPTTMLYRNLLAMEAEELIRSHPVDGLVLMGGCDKTTPGLIMAALSTNLPAIFMPAGPMLRGNWHGKPLGSGSDSWKYWAELKAGTITEREWEEVEEGIARSFGHCMTMGTASSMTAIAETMGFILPGGSSIPAADANHPRLATACGKRAVELVWEDLKPRDILTTGAVDNAIRVHMAMGGSTNAMVHVVAMARRAGLPFRLERFDVIAREVPVLADVRPSGRFLMEDFYYAGGLLGLQSQLAPLLDKACLTVNGKTLGQNIEAAKVYDEAIIRPLDKPVAREACAIIKGNLCPDGAVMKPSAADPRFFKHTGPALVFDDYNHMASLIDRDDLEVTPDHVLILRNAGPVGGPGMPEWGMLPLPTKLLKQGVRDMLRISDARMSGTSYGACILHVSPESAIGGPLALVQTGDLIRLDVEARTLDMLVDEAELTRRRLAWQPKPPPARGYEKMFAAHIRQAHEGCDFDYLEGAEAMVEPEIH